MEPCKDWMQLNLERFGPRPIKKLVFPSSHDAGTYKREFGTMFGTADNVLTQNRSILDQLCYGVRELDIRPTLNPNIRDAWFCGHYTDTSQFGWQGASCASIAEVVADVNKFTAGGHNELIIIRVSHVYKLLYSEDGASSAKSETVTPQDWEYLFRELGKLSHLYTKKEAGGATRPLHDFELAKFISGAPAVLVMIDGAPKHDQVLEYGFWPHQIWEDASGQERLKLTQIDSLVSRGQSDPEAVLSTINPLQFLGKNYFSALSLAESIQRTNMPTMLQRAVSDWWNNSDVPSKIEMDRIENGDLLTVCLALAHQRANQDAWKNESVIVYGGALITFGHVHDAFNKAKSNFQKYAVNNSSLGTDPSPGMVKSCAVLYQDYRYPWNQKDFFKGRWAREGSDLHIEEDIVRLSYGPSREMLNQRNYYILYRSLVVGDTPLSISNATFGDPDPGKPKTAHCEYTVRDSGETKHKTADEGGWMNLSDNLPLAVVELAMKAGRIFTG